MNNYLTTVELSNLLKIKPNTLATWRINGSSPFKWVKVGRRVLYDTTEIMNYLKHQQHDNTHNKEVE